jgi:hypothetical protein
MLKRLVVSVITFVFLWGGSAFAAHPLITDDTGTQGKGKTQFEFTGEYSHDAEDGTTRNILVYPTIPLLSHGLTETADLVLGVPFERIETKQDGSTVTERGISDASIQVKWRFYESSGLSVAVKPGLTLPTGNEDRGLGNGKASYSAFLIVTKELAPLAFHLTMGFLRNEYKLQADENGNKRELWHVSFAVQAEVLKGLKVVGNIGSERNPDRSSNTNPAFLLGGLIYSLKENLDIDFGVKAGLNRPETDVSYLAGLTWRL